MLARELAPGLGKSLSPDFQRNTAQAWNAAIAFVVNVPIAKFPRSTPKGSGNKGYWRPFINEASGC
jgi:hypothetical protein